MLTHRHIKKKLISKLLIRAFSWCPWITGTLKLDRILSLFKCECVPPSLALSNWVIYDLPLLTVVKGSDRWMALFGGDTYVPEKPDLGAVMHFVKARFIFVHTSRRLP